MTDKVLRVKQALILLAGLATELLNQGLLPSPIDHYVTSGLAILTTLGVVEVARRADPPGKHAEDE